MTLTLQDDSELWLTEILANQYEEARSRAASLLDAGRGTDTGCIVTDTSKPRKVRFHGRQVAAYRFIYCIQNQVVASYDDVIRHRADNKHDDWDFQANGVDFDLL